MDIQGFFSRWGLLLLIGAGVFALSYVLFGRKMQNGPAANGQTAPAMSSQVTGSTSPTVEYLPTTGDSYTNININKGNTSSVSNTTNNGTTTVTHPTIPGLPYRTANPPAYPIFPVHPIRVATVPPEPPVVVAPMPAPSQPAPANPPARRTTSYTVQEGDTLSGIASRYHTTWQQLYNINKGVIDSTAAAHGNPIPGGPWNNIFGNEVLQLPA